MATYLIKLKYDLKIGEPGYPSTVLLAGDQQTFSITKNLQKKHPGKFDWCAVMQTGKQHPGKLTSELLQDLLWDVV